MADQPTASCFWRRWLIGSLASALLVPLIFWCFGAKTEAPALLTYYAQGLVYAGCIGGMLQLLMPWVWTRVRGYPGWARWTSIVTALAFGATFGCLLVNLVFSAVGYVPWADFWPQYQTSVRFSLLITSIFGGGAMAYEAMQERLEQTTLQLRTHQLERERAEKLATEARLSSLESRIHPHFLFNTINSVSSLIQEDPVAAERLLERMSALLRFSLDSSQNGAVPLGTELKIVTDYLEIEKVRFGGRLHYTIEFPESMAQAEIPPLSVQTLVENSVKYAVAPRREGGTVRVSGTVDEERLRLRVWDDGPGFTVDAISPGHGLDNLQARLLTLYGTDAALDVHRAQGGMAVTVSLPVQQPRTIQRT